MTVRVIVAALAVALALWRPLPATAEEAPADPSSTPAPVTAPVSDEERPALERRVLAEGRSSEHAFVILPHRPNYFLFYTYNTSPNNDVYAGTGESPAENQEVKFQISFKLPVWEKMFGNNGSLYFAYTQLSFWQLYNKAFSSPFRETNYEPEGYFQFDTNFNLLGLTNRIISIGAVHQSNGRSEPLSRSWNRIFAMFVMERGNFVLSVKPWYRIPEDPASDDNPDINDYLGYGEVRALYYWKKQVFGVTVHDNLKFDENKGSVQLDWSYPMTKNLKGYVQYFNGYGESLIDYNHYNNRIGVGVMLTDWL